MKKYLINFAEGRFLQSQKICSRAALEVAGFDEVISYSFADIDESFRRKNWHILGQPIGAGYWIWKSYFILKTLNQCSEGDIVCYTDSGEVFIDSAKPLIDICHENDIVPFYMIDADGTNAKMSDDVRYKTNWERQQTKRDVFYYLNCDNMDDVRIQRIHESRPRCGSPQFYRKCDFTMQFVNEYVRYCEDYRLITNSPNTCGLPDYEETNGYRNDQSIFSVFTKMLDIKSYRDPAQITMAQLNDQGKFQGKLYANEVDCDKLYGRLMNLHRNPM